MWLWGCESRALCSNFLHQGFSCLMIVWGIESRAIDLKSLFLLHHTISRYLVILVLLLVCWLSYSPMKTFYHLRGWRGKVKLLSKPNSPVPTSAPLVIPQFEKSKCKHFIILWEPSQIISKVSTVPFFSTFLCLFFS